jgi:UDP-glucose 4-epimerase
VKIVVTGGAGFIASHVVDAYIDLGHEVVVVDDLSAGKRMNLNARARAFDLNVASPDFISLVLQERPDIINHHAAQVSPRHSVLDPINDATRNIIGSINVIEASRQAGVGKVIYVSSGGAIYGEPQQLPCPETHPVRPDSPYGASKHTPEHYLDIYQRLYGLNYTTLRYGNVYGPRQDPFGEAGVIAIFAAKMTAGEQPVINGSGDQERDFVFVADVARANVAALERGDGMAINIASSVGTSVNQIFAQLKEITGYSGDAQYGPAKAGETFCIYLDIALAASELGWTPQVRLAEGLERTMDWIRQTPA